MATPKAVNTINAVDQVEFSEPLTAVRDIIDIDTSECQLNIHKNHSSYCVRVSCSSGDPYDSSEHIPRSISNGFSVLSVARLAQGGSLPRVARTNESTKTDDFAIKINRIVPIN